MNIYKKLISFVVLFVLCIPVYGASGKSDEECELDQTIVDLLITIGEDQGLVDLIKPNANKVIDEYGDLLQSGVDIKEFDDTALRVMLDIPAINKNFDKWFDDKVTADQFDAMWNNPKVKKAISAKLRHPNSEHEWLMVSRAPELKRFGFKLKDIHDLRTKTTDLNWTIPDHPPGNDNIDYPDAGEEGSHGNQKENGKGSGKGGTRFHNELGAILDGLLNETGDKAAFMADFELELTALLKRWDVKKRDSILNDLF